MISVLIATCNNARMLGLTLAALVPAAVDGLVREVILADGGSSDATLEIADDAGARVVQGGLANACALARADWLLIVDVGHPPPAGWEDAVAARLQTPGRGAWWGLAPLLGKRAVHGLLAPTQLYREIGHDKVLAGARKLKLNQAARAGPRAR